jgi:Variant SH3 domain
LLSTIATATHAKTAKQSQDIEDGDLSNHGAKHPALNDTAESNPRLDNSKYKFVKVWLGSIADEKPLGELDLADYMEPPSTLPSLAKSTITPYDSGFVNCLRNHRIYIDYEIPPLGLIQRARDIVAGSRLSPEVEEATAQELIIKSRELRNKSEQETVQELISSLFSAVTVSDKNLASSIGQQWTNFVPVPPRPSFANGPSPSRPRPNKAFGYSWNAFTSSQLHIICLLTDQLHRSYTMPYSDLYFPFVSIEFKSQAKGGTHVIATNQAANTGAIVGYGLIELARHASELDSIDFDEPQFFSFSIDHESVGINVHWLSIDTEDGQYSFHVGKLSLHYLRDLGGIRAVQRAVKNILDWGRGQRLVAICKQLNTCGEKVRTGGPVAVASARTPIETEPWIMRKQNKRKSIGTTITTTTPDIESKELGPAPLPPKPLQSARALFDFVPEPGMGPVLGFKKGEMIEFFDAEVDEYGWIRGRADGRWGFVPAAYVEL